MTLNNGAPIKEAAQGQYKENFVAEAPAREAEGHLR